MSVQDVKSLFSVHGTISSVVFQNIIITAVVIETRFFFFMSAA